MPINVNCPTCNATLRAPDTAAGKQIKCPKCETLIKVFEATAPPESPLTSAAPPPPMASAAPAKASADRPRDEEDDRPRRREREDNDYDDRPPRRWRRPSGSGDTQSGSSNGLSLGLGIGAIALGILAAVFSLVPCCGAFVAWPAGGIGLILGLIGFTVCLMAKEKNVGAMIITGLGSLFNLGAIALATVWWLWIAAGAVSTANSAGKMAQNAQEQVERAQKERQEQQKAIERAQQDAQKDRDPLQKDQKEKQKKGKESQNPATPAEKQLSQDNLLQIRKGMLAYNDKYKAWPYPLGAEPPIKGRLSWRVAILPFIGEGELYEKFNLDEAWDSPTNRKVLESNPMPKVFASPRPKPGEERKTYYQTFTGPATIFQQDHSQVKFQSIKRSKDQLWLVAEAASAVEWTRPADISTEGLAPQLGGIFDGDFNVVCVEGMPHYVRKYTLNTNSILRLTNPHWVHAVEGWPPQ